MSWVKIKTNTGIDPIIDTDFIVSLNIENRHDDDKLTYSVTLADGSWHSLNKKQFEMLKKLAVGVGGISEI